VIVIVIGATRRGLRQGGVDTRGLGRAAGCGFPGIQCAGVVQQQLRLLDASHFLGALGRALEAEEAVGRTLDLQLQRLAGQRDVEACRAVLVRALFA